MFFKVRIIFQDPCSNSFFKYSPLIKWFKGRNKLWDVLNTRMTKGLFIILFHYILFKHFFCLFNQISGSRPNGAARFQDQYQGQRASQHQATNCPACLAAQEVEMRIVMRSFRFHLITSKHHLKHLVWWQCLT